MKTFVICFALAIALWSNDARGQCGMISLTGEFNGWNGDLFMNRDWAVPEVFRLVVVFTVEDDQNQDGFVEVIFRENADPASTWGSYDFPYGVAVPNGPHIMVPVGSYLVEFNCSSLYFSFMPTCGLISIVGEFDNWGGDGDHFMTRDPSYNNYDLWTTDISFDEGSNQYDPPNIIEVKFREDAGWNVNWGSFDFPGGIAYQDGPNIPVPLTYTGLTTDYHVDFNCATGEYYFTETSGPISLSGEFNNFTGDYFLERDETFPDQYTTILTLYPAQDFNNDGIIDMKFRENADWTFNWGSAEFPSGNAVADGPNIPVPLDNTGITTDYFVTFNYSILEFSFQSTSGNISITGAFNGWLGDVPLNRNPYSPDEWTLTRRWFADSQVKFRENNDWTISWGSNSWPSGIGTQDGVNIPLVAGTYDVTFNATSGAYNFVVNPDACGEIGMVGDFNDWGGTGNYPLDVYLLRDPDIPSRFSLDYVFYESTDLLFRLDADPDFINVWGGNTLCQTGVQSLSDYIPVPAGNYHITFDFNSGDYCFNPRGNSEVTAPRVLSMVIDGMLDEPEWEINQHVSRLIEGSPGADLNEAVFGVSYSDSYLYVGLQVTDAYLTVGDFTEFFVDGDNSGGNYDEHDVHFSVDAAGNLVVVTGPSGGIVIDAVFTIQPDGYAVEAAIPWSALDVVPVENEIKGFDIIIGDDDSGGGVEYRLSWSSATYNALSTDQFGGLTLGSLNCGCVSLYNYALGDIILRTPDFQPTNYMATYDFDDDYGMVFRHGKSNSITWGSPDFPNGTAVQGGPEIPVLQGRYRISFNCQYGMFTFEEAPAGNNVALADFTEDPPVIDGQLDEYDLAYDCNLLVAGSGPVNNTVNWGARWDMESIYIGTRVTDENIYGSGDPWNNDAIEFYIDGNNDKDGIYDTGFDNQLIMHVLNQYTPWFKIINQITNYDAYLSFTDLGYNVELRLGWDNFDFEPGRGRVIGWSLGNDDNDYNIGRDYQTVWYGTDLNWNNTSLLGDLQLANGPYTGIPEKDPAPDQVLIYPNPTEGRFYILLKGKGFGEKIQINVKDISGRSIAAELHAINGESNLFSLNMEQANPGIYVVQLYSDNGNYFAKKLIIK